MTNGCGRVSIPAPNVDVAAPFSKSSRKAGHQAVDSREIDLLALTAVDGLGDEGLAHVLEQARRCSGSLEDFYQSDLERLQSYYGDRKSVV